MAYDTTQSATRHVDQITAELANTYCQEDAAFLLSQMKGYYRKTKQRELIAMLRNCGIRVPDDPTDEQLGNLLERMPDLYEAERKLYRILSEHYRDFAAADDYMTRLVREYAPEFSGDSIRLAILKKFYKNYLNGSLAIRGWVESRMLEQNPDVDVDKLTQEEILNNITEEIFDLLDNLPVKKINDKYPLVLIANDLASGKVRSNRKTREYLYTFALGFDMKPQEVEKRLFWEYYGDNLLRYISDTYLAEPGQDQQLEPTGEGINYKNYAEVIFLYYLNTDLPPQKKYSQSAKAIKKCRDQAVAKGLLKEPGYADKFTTHYRALFDVILALKNEQELLDYIHRNFVFPLDLSDIGKTESEAWQHSAAKQYDKKLSEVLRDISAEALSQVQFYPYLSRGIVRIGNEDPKFPKLMEQLNKMLRIRWVSPISGTENAVKLTRTHLIALYAYDFYRRGNCFGLPLSKLLPLFAAYVNPALKEARYQPFSTKNIFDIYAVVTLYLAERKYFVAISSSDPEDREMLLANLPPRG